MFWRHSNIPLCLHQSPVSRCFFLFEEELCRRGGGGECQHKHRSAGFFTSRASRRKLISRYWFLTAATLIALPSGALECFGSASPPSIRSLDRRSDNLHTSPTTPTAFVLKAINWPSSPSTLFAWCCVSGAEWAEFVCKDIQDQSATNWRHLPQLRLLPSGFQTTA